MKCPKCASEETSKVYVTDLNWHVGHQRCNNCGHQDDWGLFCDPPVLVSQFIAHENQKMEDLEKIIKDYFTEVQHGKIIVTFPEGNCNVHLSKTYEGLGDWVSFKTLSWLSKILGTEEINLRNEHYREGCDTCDWGSEHEVDIVCLNIKR